ncbi:FdhD protein [Alteribacillus iranensis]|uniref:Sulfur carrier protein FdhD n=1 Tax=Alteribacillus iranensis TaxID=930128 RepID=A0A1I1ZWV3_9BACI|nr:FdhD protein [Alteribacillus iranensis]
MSEMESKIEPVITYRNGHFTRIEDEIAVEKPLTIIINEIEFATIVCSPTDLRELVIGFLVSEGVIFLLEDVHSLDIDEERGFVYVNLNKPVPDPSHYTKRLIGSCCGKSRQFYFHNDLKTAKTATSSSSLSPQQCLVLMEKLQSQSALFDRTGGVHNAALCTSEDILLTRSDIGRHNALDKLYGYCLVNKINVRNKVLVFSGRLSSEILTKAAKIGVGIVLSKSAPTDLTIRLAQDLNITAVGFLRNESFNVYSHPERIVKNSKGGVSMGKCNIDHSLDSVREKLESQRSYLPDDVYQHSQTILGENPDQTTLNELFHLLKKYDLADIKEKQERDEKIIALTM